MNNLKTFKNEKFGKLRTVMINDKPHIVAVDVTKALGYKNPNKAVRDHCRWVTKQRVPHPQSKDKNKTIEVNCIPEGDIYRLIAHSELPEAEQFESWVFDEVLPTIRKTGGYVVEGREEEFIDIYFPTLSEETKKSMVKDLQGSVKELRKEIKQLKPNADYTNKILQNKGLVTITQIAKDYGMSGQAMNDLLHKLKVQYKQSGQWLLYGPHQHKGYTHSETFNVGEKQVKMHTKWTQKGRMFIYELLKEHDILPIIEKQETFLKAE